MAGCKIKYPGQMILMVLKKKDPLLEKEVYNINIQSSCPDHKPEMGNVILLRASSRNSGT